MGKSICAITTVEITQSNFVIPAMRVLKSHGWDVTLICNMTPDFIRNYKDEFELINIPFHRGVSIRDLAVMPFRLAWLFKHRKFDIVQYATPNAALYSSLGARIAGIRNRVYCQWGIRYVGANGIMRKILKGFEKITCINSTAIRPASKKNLEFSVKENLYNIDKANIIGEGGTVGIDLKEFDLYKKEQNRVEVFEEYPVLKDKAIFAFVGRLNRDKGIFELLESFVRIHKDNPQTALLLIGDFDGELPAHLKAVRNNPDVISTGWIENVPKYLSAADFLVHPSYREGFSMVIQQAMSLAIPVITTNIPGPSEVIEDGISGILVEPKSSVSLYNAMIWALSHRIESANMGKSGRKRCENHFTRERLLELTLADRESLIK